MGRPEKPKVLPAKERMKKGKKPSRPHPSQKADSSDGNTSDETQIDEPEAGPSSLTLDMLSDRSDIMRNDRTRKNAEFTTENDFISFVRESDPERPLSTSAREWDKGKAVMRSGKEEHAGRKRRWEEVTQDDDISTVKRKADAATRRAPWTKSVDWETCRNVAEM